ncbi:hypothetical protein E8E11_009729 [Didymella keratinophila]|nr:hypothetical protein E8E11_009729 [Didymella keratinophila]
MAQSLKSTLAGNTNILVTTGGGSYLATSLLDHYFSCTALDVLAIHAYGVGDFDTSKSKPYVDRANSANKKLIMQERGACYTDASNNNCNRSSPISTGTCNANIKQWAAQIDAAGIP